MSETVQVNVKIKLKIIIIDLPVLLPTLMGKILLQLVALLQTASCRLRDLPILLLLLPLQLFQSFGYLNSI